MCWVVRRPFFSPQWQPAAKPPHLPNPFLFTFRGPAAPCTHALVLIFPLQRGRWPSRFLFSSRGPTPLSLFPFLFCRITSRGPAAIPLLPDTFLVSPTASSTEDWKSLGALAA